MNNQFKNITDNINKILFLNVLKQPSRVIVFNAAMLVFKNEHYKNQLPVHCSTITAFDWINAAMLVLKKKKKKTSTPPMSQVLKKKKSVFNWIIAAMLALKRQLKQTTLSLFQS